MKTTDPYDIEQRLNIVDTIYRAVMLLENEELSSQLSGYQSDNIQWVLNVLQGIFDELEHVLDLEESNYIDY
jgi:hypothetical protein